MTSFMRSSGVSALEARSSTSGCISVSARRSSNERGSRKKEGIVTRVKSWPGIRLRTADGRAGGRAVRGGEELGFV